MTNLLQLSWLLLRSAIAIVVQYSIPGNSISINIRSLCYIKMTSWTTSYIYTDTEKSVTKQKYNTEKKEQKTI